MATLLIAHCAWSGGWSWAQMRPRLERQLLVRSELERVAPLEALPPWTLAQEGQRRASPVRRLQASVQHLGPA